MATQATDVFCIIDYKFNMIFKGLKYIMNAENKKNNTSHLSLMTDGPLYQFYLWARLVKPILQLYKRRIIVICLFAWLPLLLLSLANGVAFNNAKIPFLWDIEVHIRFLVSLSLLLYAEIIANKQIQIIVNHFYDTTLMTSESKSIFKSIIESTKDWAHSFTAELILLVFVIIIGYAVSLHYLPNNISTWYTTQNNQLNLAGLWYIFVSLPIFQFILLRWYYRLILWYRFIWKVSRLPLQLNSLHPDKAGGLGFLINSAYAFEPFLLAHSFLLAGMIFNRIWLNNATLLEFRGEIIFMWLFLVLLPLTPLMFFIPALAKTKRLGTLAYDKLADKYVSDFSKKWMNPSANDKALLGTSDIQSLADLGNSFNISADMRITPFNKHNIFLIFILTSLPLLPLIIFAMPVEKIISQLIGIIL